MKASPLLAFSITLGLIASPAMVIAQDGDGDTKVSTQIFINASDLEHNGPRTPQEGTAVELKRAFLNIDHRFSEAWSLHLTTDMQWLRNSDASDVWLRHAYVQRSFGKDAWLRIGSAPMPWIAAESKREGFRYVDPSLIARAGMGNPADYGAHGSIKHGQFVYEGSLVTGAGYRKPRLGNRADAEVRVAWLPVEGVELALGAYNGTRAQDAGDRTREHDAQRWNAMASWVGKRTRVGAQYFRSENWNTVVRPDDDAQRGWSAWGSYEISPQYAVFTRNEETRMSLRMDPRNKSRYHTLGLQWQPNSHLKLAATGKHITQDTAASSVSTNEFGLWSQLAF